MDPQMGFIAIACLLSLSAAVTIDVIQEHALLTDWGGFRE